MDSCQKPRVHIMNVPCIIWTSQNRWIIIMFLKMMFKNPQERTLFLGWRKKVWLWRVPSPMPPLPGNKALLGVIKGHWWFHASNLSIWPYSWGWHCGGYPAVSMISWVRKKKVRGLNDVGGMLKNDLLCFDLGEKWWSCCWGMGKNNIGTQNLGRNSGFHFGGV